MARKNYTSITRFLVVVVLHSVVLPGGRSGRAEDIQSLEEVDSSISCRVMWRRFPPFVSSPAPGRILFFFSMYPSFVYVRMEEKISLHTALATCASTQRGPCSRHSSTCPMIVRHDHWRTRQRLQGEDVGAGANCVPIVLPEGLGMEDFRFFRFFGFSGFSVNPMIVVPSGRSRGRRSKLRVNSIGSFNGAGARGIEVER